ncbi:GNAT family N-acetyltransferase, partial [Rhizobium johnstonii]
HGYIWSVYVADAFRRRGIALALTNNAVDYLKSIGCTTAVIHASDAGEPVYRTRPRERVGGKLGSGDRRSLLRRKLQEHFLRQFETSGAIEGFAGIGG